MNTAKMLGRRALILCVTLLIPVILLIAIFVEAVAAAGVWLKSMWNFFRYMPRFFTRDMPDFYRNHW